MKRKRFKEVDVTVLGGSDVTIPHPKVCITQLAIQKIKCFVDLCEYEINGFGIVEKEGNDFVIKDVFLVKQVTHDLNMHVKTDKDALNDLIYRIVKGGGCASSIKFQWHSHVHMQAYFSPEDVDTIEGYMNDVMISLVMNKRGEYQCRLDLYKPFRLSLNTPLFVQMPNLEESVVQKCAEEMVRNVKVKKTICKIPVWEKDIKPHENDLESMPVIAENIQEKGGGDELQETT